MKLFIEFEREDDGRWIAEIPELPGCMVYGTDLVDAPAKVKKLALQILIDKAEHDNAEVPAVIEFHFKNPLIDYLEHAPPEEIEDMRQQFKRDLEAPPKYDPAELAAAGLTEEQAEGIRHAMEQIDRGETVPAEEVYAQAIARARDASLAAIRKALADVPAVTGVEAEEVPAETVYYIGISHYDPSVTRDIAKRLAGKGLRCHVVAGAKSDEGGE